MAAGAIGGAAKIAAGGKGAVDAVANEGLRRGLDWLLGILLGFSWLVFPLIAVSLVMAFELLLQYVRPSWQLALWRKVTYIVTIFLTSFLVLITVGLGLYISEHPDEACQAFGGVWSVAGTVGACSAAQGLFEALL